MFVLEITNAVQAWDHDDPTGLMIAAASAEAARAIAEVKWREGYNRPDLAKVWLSEKLSTAQELVPAQSGIIGEARIYYDHPAWKTGSVLAYSNPGITPSGAPPMPTS